MRPVGSATQMESSGRKRQESVQNATECVDKRATSEMREIVVWMSAVRSAVLKNHK